MKHTSKTIKPFLNQMVELKYVAPKFRPESEDHTISGTITQIRNKDIKFRLNGITRLFTIPYKDIIEIKNPESCDLK